VRNREQGELEITMELTKLSILITLLNEMP
jgi:hypothetical protein